ncbi:hypothetical protein L2E82_46531 [Cichorium intybus]|uniref:Uncharacterized protein n=1 Tax=Cichorium intybus TaxID=13427 RepID=A0ACB8YSN8_CICIN|nr:hypothetical protein L1887_26237 [Cichorium endivia]KAI3688739.1 hypothetical protein L2E82_46531 [Cichorium intybus]
MEIDEESVKLSLNNELTKTAHLLSVEAHKQNHPYITNTKKHGSASSSMEVSIFAFPGSWDIQDWYQDDYFGETDVDFNLFPSLLRVGVNRLAKVNAVFLQLSKNLLNNLAFKAEVEKAVKENKKILFTGHSSGGAIASLATLWMLDKYVKHRKIRFPIGCVTFGSPLIGDRTLSHAVRREKWAGHFTHFVMEHDIVPRIMLAPKISIQEHLPNILRFFQQKLNPTNNKSRKFPKFFHKSTPGRTIDQDPIDEEQAIELFENVMMSASTVASHVAYNLMEPTNSLMKNLADDFVKVSPYRPFGYYVFCTKPLQQFRVENPDAVLQLLFYFLQLADENQNLSDFAVNSIEESFSYEEELKNGLQLESLVDLKDLNKNLLTPDGTAGDAVRTSNKALFELSASARCCLMAAEEAENRKKENEKRINMSMRKHAPPEDTRTRRNRTELKIIEDILDEIRKYKNKHAQGNNDYYEAFKLQDENDDFVVNVDRLKMAKIFDEIVEMVMRDDLPDEFEGREDWVKVGTEFRRLFEPLDIGNYYRHSKGDGYMDVRPKRYKFTQRWYEHANGMRFELVSESNFVAKLEEIKKEVEETKKKTVEEVKEEVESVKEQVRKWFSDAKIPKEDVFWGESFLSTLEEKLL